MSFEWQDTEVYLEFYAPGFVKHDRVQFVDQEKRSMNKSKVEEIVRELNKGRWQPWVLLTIRVPAEVTDAEIIE